MIRSIINWWRNNEEVEELEFRMVSSDTNHYPPPPPPPSPCSDCGGIFLWESLTPRLSIAITVGDITSSATTIQKLYCKDCLPESDFVLTLNDGPDGADDYRYFQAQAGWFQEIDNEDGEERYSVSTQEWESFHCAECGEQMSCKKCPCQKAK